ncbi:hypothetical protein RBU49_08120 [Clostridium sp. MB40-C1]|uniref:hypothetical protein n=1 Tax=Clostridium sp. MB40-C1 TaxID=3070996 RepID=UPI0027E05E48|nr:hypothetical protein [Clostridium sp. MB40-C1]WMJ82205.1 hypothetical protein RBU49_08120 [Clostridium sp. MB40-C1]
MSLFLGKVHYWLFNKIEWFENLEEEIVNFGEKENLSVREWKEAIYEKYGTPTEKKPLEEIIDTSNIHGWLQSRIEAAEKRHAAWITKILNENIKYKNDLIKIFEQQGKEAGREYRLQNVPIKNTEDIYKALNDFILEGMPCDRVNEVMNISEDEFSWRTVRCLHKQYWEEIKGDVRNFYDLRDSWINGFIKEINDKFTFQRYENGIQKIIRK